MTEPENSEWHDALDRAVPEPAVPGDMLDRVSSRVRVTRRRRRWTAAGSSLAAVAVVVAAVTLPGSGSSARQGAPAASPNPRATPSVSTPAPSLAAPTPTVPVVVGPAHTHPCTSGDNPIKALGLLPLPADFVPVQVYECYETSKTFADGGTWQVLLGVRLTGDLSPLVAALRKPDIPFGQQPTGLPSGAVLGCADDLVLAPVLVIYDSAGKAVRARTPVDECEKPQTAVGDAVRKLAQTTVQVIKLQQTETAAQDDDDKRAVAAGCGARQFKDLLSFPGKASKGGPIAWNGPVALCLYADDAKDPSVGDFVNGRRLTSQEKAGLRDATALPGSAKPCTAQHTQFLVVFDKTAYTTIEVGGCSRVERPNDGLGAANPTAIAALVTSLG